VESKWNWEAGVEAAGVGAEVVVEVVEVLRRRIPTGHPK